jgi:F0F1-type ATP synthase epsilon subunit
VAKKDGPTEEKVNNKDKKGAKEELDSKSLNVKIYSPYKVYFDGEAKSVSAENDTGPFDILPKHHNFMTLLNPGEVTVRKDDGELKYRIARGVMHVRKNKATIFLDV